MGDGKGKRASETHDAFTASALNWCLRPASQTAEPDSVGKIHVPTEAHCCESHGHDEGVWDPPTKRAEDLGTRTHLSQHHFMIRKGPLATTPALHYLPGDLVYYDQKPKHSSILAHFLIYFEKYTFSF